MRVANLISLFFFMLMTSVNAQPNQPNILWIVCEDISPDLSMYGDSTAYTPNLDALAASATVYTHAFTTAGVCAPSRSSIITGMYQTSIGTMHMRTGNDVFSWGKRTYPDRVNFTDLRGDTLRKYSTVIPEEVKCFPEYLRREGYFCSNNAKTDYQFAAPLSAWDENGDKAHWRNREALQPFFSVFNIGLTHESRLWRHADLPLTVDPEKVKVPPYLQDTKLSREIIARHYSNVELMDARVGEIIAELKADGLYDDTIIFFYSDHGGPLPREKREVFDSGIHVPLLIKPIHHEKAGKDDRLISFVDLAPTILSLAGIQPPVYMQGEAFLGDFEEEKVRNYVFAGSDRLDECTDRVRSLRNKRFLYVYNAYPEKPHYEDLAYRKNIASMIELLELRDKSKLNEDQEKWFGPKDREELYDCQDDPYNMNNLADDPDYKKILDDMRLARLKHVQDNQDLGLIPEGEFIRMIWPDGKQPKTAVPGYNFVEGRIHLDCSTPGSSIVYHFSDQIDESMDFDAGWELYSKHISPQNGKYLYVVAERIGYAISEIVVIKM
jgi:N-sulfoglucosamine sulfohydrolase